MAATAIVPVLQGAKYRKERRNEMGEKTEFGFFGENKNYKKTRYYKYASDPGKKLFDLVMQELKNNPDLTGRVAMGTLKDIVQYLEYHLDIDKSSLII